MRRVNKGRPEWKSSVIRDKLMLRSADDPPQIGGNLICGLRQLGTGRREHLHPPLPEVHDLGIYIEPFSLGKLERIEPVVEFRL